MLNDVRFQISSVTTLLPFFIFIDFSDAFVRLCSLNNTLMLVTVRKKVSIFKWNKIYSDF